MKIFLLLISFVFVLSSILYMLFIPELRIMKFKRKVRKLIEWAKQNPNCYTNEPEPARLFGSLDRLQRKLSGEWTRFIERPEAFIHLLRLLECYPDSFWMISGRALERILNGEVVPEDAKDEVVLRLGFGENVMRSS